MAFSLMIGSLDFTSYIKVDGFDISRNDIDAPGSGRDAAGTMRRKVIARKDKISATCRQLTEPEMGRLISALQHNTVTVTYSVPGMVTSKTAEFYNSERKLGVSMVIDGSVIYKEGTTFNLIEV